jgi:hypothetical protein
MKKILLLLAVLSVSAFANAEAVKQRSLASESDEELKTKVAFYKEALRKTSLVYVCEDAQTLTAIAYQIWGLKSYKVTLIGAQSVVGRNNESAVCVIWSN